MSSIRLGPYPIASVWSNIISPSILKLELPEVNYSDCNNCPLPKGPITGPHKACCDYRPNFPNFVVGEMLVENISPLIEEWVDGGRGCPGWVHSPSTEAGLCPMLGDDGLCRIYEHRYYLCATWHCVYQSEEEMYLWQSMLELMSESIIGTSRFLIEKRGSPDQKFLSIYNRLLFF